MSWKSLVSAGLMCIVASPVLAAPTLSVTYDGMDAGNHLWNVSVTPDVADTPLAFELGFRSLGGNITNVQAINPPLDTENPGNPIFGWETLTDVGGGNMKPEGIQFGNAGNEDEAFVAYGSDLLSAATDILTITTQGSVTDLAFGGIYNANGTMGTPGTDFLTGLVAQLDAGGTNSVNFYGFSGSVPVGGGGFIPGDFDGGGAVEGADLSLLLGNWGNDVATIPATWDGDQPTPQFVDGDDLSRLLGNWGNIAGAGAALSTSVVPEPVSVVLVGFAALAIGVFRRSRS